MSSKSRKASGQVTSPESTAPAPTTSTSSGMEGHGGVENFMIRVMAERMSTGKRPIRPKPVCDEFLAEESDDPDFEMNSSASDKSNSGTDSSDSESDSDNDSEGDSQVNKTKDEEDGESGSSDSEASNSPVSGNSSQLRAAMKKMEEQTSSFLSVKRKRKPKPKKKKVSDGPATTTATAETDNPVKTETKEVVKKKPAKPRNRSKTTTATTSKKGKQSKPPPSTNGKKKEKRSKRESKKSTKYENISALVSDVNSTMLDTRKYLDWKDPICAACLSSVSTPSNEIFECDSCRITVHEGCYIFYDNMSVSSRTDSSSSTTPWFCDACRNNRTNLSCELCPNTGGLFKETSDGRWVHLVCSVYLPSIHFSHEGKPNIMDVPYSKYGCHPCNLCENKNERMATVGMCVNCDAGLCRVKLHATCAQKDGLLSTPKSLAGHSSSPDQAADPYYASCKAHMNSDVAKGRALNYKRLQEQIRIKINQRSILNLTETQRTNQEKVQLKLEKIRRRIETKEKERLCDVSTPATTTTTTTKKTPTKRSRQSIPNSAANLPGPSTSSLIGPYKIPSNASPAFLGFRGKKRGRGMQSSSAALVHFDNKCGRYGYNMCELEAENNNERIVASAAKKWNVRPTMNVEFVAYYLDRDKRINSLTEKCTDLGKENVRLNGVQDQLSSALEDGALDHMEAYEEAFKLDGEINLLKTILKQLVPENKKINNIRGANIPKLKSPGRRSPNRSRSPPKGARSSRTQNKKGGKKAPAASTSPGRLAIFCCAICKSDNTQHLLTRCDQCRKHFHLSCLDPPLSRQPRRTRLCGWMCSDCGDEDDGEEESTVDTEAPRELRGRTNIKRPAKYTEFDESEEEGVCVNVKSEAARSSGSSPTLPIRMMDMNVRVKMEPLPPNIPNGSVVRVKRDPSPEPDEHSEPEPSSPSPGPSDGGASGKDDADFKIRIRPPRKPRASRSRAATKRKSTPRKKKETTASKKQSVAKSNGLSPGEQLPGPNPRKRARVTSGASRGSIPLVDLLESPTNSPGTCGLTAAEKDRVDARSSYSYGSSSTKESMSQAVSNVFAGKVPSIPTTVTEPVKQKSAKKPRKQKIIPKDSVKTKSEINNFWNEPADIVMVARASAETVVPFSSSPIPTKCDTCGKSEPVKSLVTCDKCNLDYHFFCLVPPLKYTPRRRGYSWFCANCDETSSIEIDMNEIIEVSSKSSN